VNDRKHSRFITFIERHKGDVALTLSFILYLVSWPLALLNHSAAGLARAAGEASLVGGLCDYIALNMIFEKHWYLPNSGVLPRNREKLIEGIATTIEREWLTPAMIGQKLHDLNPLDRLGEYLNTASLKTMVRPDQLERLCNEAAHLLEPQTVTNVLQSLSARVAPPGPFDRVRLAVINAFIRRESEHIRRTIRGLPRNERLLAAADSAIHDLGGKLREEDSVVRKTADHWMEALVREVVVRSRGEITRMVRENLDKLSNDAIRMQIETRTRTHLDWIRVNGGVFGAVLGCVFALLNAAQRDFHWFARFGF
jgi:uncharacterized membrane-anchored protein YjiN (DUF445 family)